MRKFRHAVESAVLLIVRLGFGAGLFYRGLTRVLDGSDAYVATLVAAGLPWPTVFFWGSVALEMGGGVMLAAGVLTRLVGAVLVVQFVMTTAWIHWWNGFFVRDNGYEYAVAQGLLGLVLAGFGGGVVAVDQLIFGRKKNKDKDVTAATMADVIAP